MRAGRFSECIELARVVVSLPYPAALYSTRPGLGWASGVCITVVTVFESENDPFEGCANEDNAICSFGSNRTETQIVVEIVLAITS